MAINQTTLETYLDEAVTAVGNGSYSTVRTKLAQAEIVLAGMPDHAIGNRRIQYRNQIQEMFGTLDKLEASSTANKKNRRVFVKYERE